jgi:hypothetical protein
LPPRGRGSEPERSKAPAPEWPTMETTLQARRTHARPKRSLGLSKHRIRPQRARPRRGLSAPAQVARSRGARPTVDRGLWVSRPTVAVGYGMPSPRARASEAWAYTRPTHVRGAFIRALNGVLMRRGRAQRSLRALHVMCAGGAWGHLGAPREGALPTTQGARLAPALRGVRARRPLSLLAPTARASHGLPPDRRGTAWDALRAQPRLTYGLKYCRLSRRVRKILRNKYRYAKYTCMIPPRKRLMATLHV